MKTLFSFLTSILLISSVFAQTQYENSFEQIRQLESQGKTTDAYRQTKKLIGNFPDDSGELNYAKAYIYYAKFKLMLEEESENEVFFLLQQKAQEAKPPAKQIFNLYLGQSAYAYLNENYYDLKNRPSVDHNPKDIKTWDIADFKNLIFNAYDRSFTDLTTLENTKADKLLDLITQMTKQKEIHLLSLIAQERSEFLERIDNIPAIGDHLAIDQEYHWLPSADFVNINLPETHSYDINRLQLQLFQKMESFYLEKQQEKDRLHWQLDRLAFLNDRYEDEDAKDSLYINALEKLDTTLQKDGSRSRIQLKKAFYYKERADYKEHPDYLNKAIDLAKSSYERADAADIKRSAVELINSIKQPYLKFSVQKQLYPQKPGKIRLIFQNTPQVCLAFYKYSPEKLHNEDDYRQSLIQKQSPDFQHQLEFPQAQDHFKHKAEVLLPKLPAGHYFMLGTKETNIDPEKDFHTITNFRVSKIALQQINYKDKTILQTLDLQSGLPLYNTKMILKKDNYAINWTNKQGIIETRIEEKFWLEAIHKGDTLHKQVHHRNYYNQRDKNVDYSAKILTDRNIYKPGQNVSFKTYLVRNEDQQAEMIAEKEIDVSLFDVNNERIAEKTLTTNQWGTASGEFSIPQDRLLGTYKIKIETEKINGNYLRSRSASFQVEKYKRPDFEVKLDDFAANPILGQPIEVNGKVRAFFGGKITGAVLQYEVKRNLRNYYKYNEYADVDRDPEIIKTGELKMDESGDFAFEFLPIPISSIPKKEKPIFYYTVNIRVTDQKGETQGTSGKIAVGYHTTQLLDNANRKIDVSQEDAISLIAKDLNSRPSSFSGKLKLTKYKTPDGILKDRSWELPEIQQIDESTFRKLFPHQAYQPKELPENFKLDEEHQMVFDIQEVEKFEVVAQELKNLPGGLYQLQFEGKGQNGFSLEKEQQIKLVNPKKPADYFTSFLSAETQITDDQSRKFSLQLQNRLEKAYVQITILSDTDFHQQQHYILDKGTQTFDFDVPDSLKRVAVKTRLVHRQNIEMQTHYIGFKNQQYQLNIATENIKKTIRPDEPQQVEVQVTDQDGNPVKAELLASMYDTSLNEFVSNKWFLNLKRSRIYIKNNLRAYADFDGINYYSNMKNRAYYYSRYPKYKRHGIYRFGYDFMQPERSNQQYLKTLQRLTRLKSADDDSRLAVGFVVDQDGLPIPGVNVQVKGKNKTTQTDFNGFYELITEPNAQLTINYLGYQEKIVNANRSESFIVLEQSSEMLEEVVKSGYSRNTKEIIKVEEYAEVTEEVPFSSGDLSNPNDPLYVVNGKITSKSQMLQLEQSDIGEMKVLKGAEARRLYGNKARKGVVVITTKAEQQNQIFQQVKLREDLKETAFFFPHIQTDDNGKAQIDFTAPQRLTNWNFRIAAHDQKAKASLFNQNIRTQKALNISANFPRFVRYGDTIQVSVSLTNLTDKVLNTQVSLRLKDQDQVLGDIIFGKDATQDARIHPADTEIIEWKLAIPKHIKSLKFEVAAQTDEFSDGMSQQISVLPDYQILTQYLSKWILPNTTEKYNLAKHFTTISTDDKLHLDYQINPAWNVLKNLPFLVQYPYNCSEQTFAKLFAYQVGQSVLLENPELATYLDKQAEDQPEEFNRLKATSFQSLLSKKEKLQSTIRELVNEDQVIKRSDELLRRLEKMQLTNGAFPWFSGGRANLRISIHLLTGFHFIEKQDLSISKEDRFIRIKRKLSQYLDKQFLSDDDQPDRFILDYLFARSAGEKDQDFSRFADDQIQLMENDWLSFHLRDKLVYASVLSRLGKKQEAEKVRENLSQTTVLNPRLGKYWKKYSSYNYFSPVLDQSLAIEAFSYADNSTEEIGLLKQWLIGYNAHHQPASTIAQTYFLQSISQHTRQFDESASLPEIRMNGKKIKASSTDRQAGKIDQDLEISPSQDQRLQVRNRSDELQQLQVELTAQRPIADIPETTHDNLSLKKQIFKVKNQNDEQKLIPIDEADVQVGDLIRIKLIINSKKNYEFMALIDHRPACFQALEVLSGYKRSSRLFYYQTNQVTEMNFFFDQLPKGIHALTYDVKVTHSGQFQTGNANLSNMYAPKVKVNTQSRRLEVE